LKLYRKQNGMWLERDDAYLRLEESFDLLVAREDLQGYLTSLASTATTAGDFDGSNVEAPIGHQEVWAAGVTYYRSRTARIEESQDGGGGSFYDRVYSAERPELFFKAMAHKVAAPNGEVRIRRDASWSEPELVLLVNPRGEIIGYTIGNDVSSRDIEVTNPLYLPQAKVYDQSCALGPCVLISDGWLPASTRIQMQIHRDGHEVLAAAVTLAEMKRETGGASAVSVSGSELSLRVLSADRDGHCSSQRIHAAEQGRDTNVHRWHWDAGQPCSVMAGEGGGRDERNG
jgi:2-dehydro-3-deoxy-D-arabinonate dehydratase